MNRLPRNRYQLDIFMLYVKLTLKHVSFTFDVEYDLKRKVLSKN